MAALHRFKELSSAHSKRKKEVAATFMSYYSIAEESIARPETIAHDNAA